MSDGNGARPSSLSIEEFEDKEFSALERKRLRRMLQDDGYARRFRTTVKVWVLTIGAVGSAVAALSAIWDKFFR